MQVQPDESTSCKDLTKYDPASRVVLAHPNSSSAQLDTDSTVQLDSARSDQLDLSAAAEETPLWQYVEVAKGPEDKMDLAPADPTTRLHPRRKPRKAGPSRRYLQDVVWAAASAACDGGVDEDATPAGASSARGVRRGRAMVEVDAASVHEGRRVRARYTASPAFDDSSLSPQHGQPNSAPSCLPSDDALFGMGADDEASAVEEAAYDAAPAIDKDADTATDEDAAATLQRLSQAAHASADVFYRSPAPSPLSPVLAAEAPAADAADESFAGASPADAAAFFAGASPVTIGAAEVMSILRGSDDRLVEAQALLQDVWLLADGNADVLVTVLDQAAPVRFDHEALTACLREARDSLLISMDPYFKNDVEWAADGEALQVLLGLAGVKGVTVEDQAAAMEQHLASLDAARPTQQVESGASRSPALLPPAQQAEVRRPQWYTALPQVPYTVGGATSVIHLAQPGIDQYERPTLPHVNDCGPVEAARLLEAVNLGLISAPIGSRDETIELLQGLATTMPEDWVKGAYAPAVDGPRSCPVQVSMAFYADDPCFLMELVRPVFPGDCDTAAEIYDAWVAKCQRRREEVARRQ